MNILLTTFSLILTLMNAQKLNVFPENISSYTAGTKACYQGKVVQCKEFPYSPWCTQEFNIPLTDLGQRCWNLLTEQTCDSQGNITSQNGSGSSGNQDQKGTASICYGDNMSSYVEGTVVCYGGKETKCRVGTWCQQDAYNLSYVYWASAWEVTNKACSISCSNASYPIYQPGDAVNNLAYNYSAFVQSLSSGSSQQPIIPPIVQPVTPPVISPITPPVIPPVVQPVTPPVIPIITPPVAPPIIPGQEDIIVNTFGPIQIEGYPTFELFDSIKEYANAGNLILYQRSFYKNTYWTQGQIPLPGSAWAFQAVFEKFDYIITVRDPQNLLSTNSTLSLDLNYRKVQVKINQEKIIPSYSLSSKIVMEGILINGQVMVLQQTSSTNILDSQGNIIGYKQTFDLAKVPISTKNISLNISGLPVGAQATVLIYYKYTYTFNTLVKVTNGINQIQVKDQFQFSFRIQQYFPLDKKIFFQPNSVQIIPLDFSKVIQVVFAQMIQPTRLWGYFTQWGDAKTISHYSRVGKYTDIYLAFADLKDGKVEWMSNFAGYNNSSAQGYVSMYDDIAQLRKEGKVFNVLVSFGGEHNKFNFVGITDYTKLALNIINFSVSVGANGIDFDLEDVGIVTGQDAQNVLRTGMASIEDFGKAIRKLIVIIKTIDPTFIISIAPQFNMTGATECNMVNTGTQLLYDQFDDVIDVAFIQNYNTPHYFIKEDGTCEMTEVANSYNQKSVKFLTNVLRRLRQILPSRVTIVLGQPATANAAGAGTIFHNSQYAGNPYKALCLEYKSIYANNTDIQVHAGTWSCQKDSEDPKNMPFAKAVTSIDCSDI